MHRSRYAPRFAFLAGLLMAVALLAAFGAGHVAAPVSPQYSVQYAGSLLLITNNQTNELLVYENSGEESVLRTTVDLNQTGRKTFQGKVPDATATGESRKNKIADLEPGSEYRITAEIRGTVTELTKDAVFLKITAIEEVATGEPILNNVPYVARLFKNVGIERSSTEVLIEIPKERVSAVKTIKVDP